MQRSHFFKFSLKSTLNSYSQVFFSNNQLLACLLILVTFFDIYAGISGLISVVCTNYLALWIGFNEENIRKGYYGFNSLLVGLGVGIFYEPSLVLYCIVCFAAMLTLFISIAMEGVIGKYTLPYLSIPFLLSIWIVTLASRHYDALEISHQGVYRLNEMYAIGGPKMVDIYQWFDRLSFAPSISIYLKSLGAIFFQYNLLAGLLIVIGILIYSRIAFSLSLIGFYAAYGFYYLVGAKFTDIGYSYIGFNFILSAIAIGGFFIIPSRFSYFWTVLLTPLIAILITGTNAVFSFYQLSIYSLPFNMVVLLFLYILKFREKRIKQLEVVSIQHNVPERNLYTHINYQERFGKATYIPVLLPFWGEWKVSQGNNGKITHKKEWKYAWDFIITDNSKQSFKNRGTDVTDFYCYEKPVLAPADGTVEEIIDNVEDNAIGDVNLQQNWGNTIIIKHTPTLFSKISHLKSGTFEVEKGDFVKHGDVLAHCGNSGRSPEPHVHFQMQSTPFIGSNTLEYPITNYILHKDSNVELISYSNPKEGDIISNITTIPLLYDAFHFIPGQKLQFEVVIDNKKSNAQWEVFTDAYNNSYIWDESTQSTAWFNNDSMIHYFKHFEGDKQSTLYYFFLAAYKVSLGFYNNLNINDKLPIHFQVNKSLLFIQDFIAPFYQFLKSDYTLNYHYIDDEFYPQHIILQSKTKTLFNRKVIKHMDFQIEINEKGINELIINTPSKI